MLARPGRDFAVALLALAVLWPVTAAGAPPAEEKSVLLLYAESMLLLANTIVDRELRAALGSDAATPVCLYTEALDCSWFPHKEVERATLDLLRAKYANHNLALVMPVGPPAVRFALLHRAAIFPGVPMVFVAGRAATVADLPLPSDVTGMWMDRDWRANIELILRPPRHAPHRVHLGSRRDALHGGRVQAGRRQLSRPLRADRADRFRFDELLKRAAALPEHTVVLFGLFLRDSAGRTFVNTDVAAHLARVAPVPVYSSSAAHVGQGIVGGYVVSYEQQAQRAAALALRVLRGEPRGPAAATSDGTNAYMFDARVLKRWAIRENRLPPGSVVR